MTDAAPQPAPPVAAPPAAPPPEPPPPGYVCPAAERPRVLAVVVALGAVAFSFAAPALFEIGDHLRASTSTGVARWAFVLLALAIVQGALATFAWQAPDWASIFAAAIWQLCVAMGLAFVFGLLVAGRAEQGAAQWLDLTEAMRSDLARLWCFFALAATSGAAFGLGRYGLAWRRRLVAGRADA